MGKIVSMMEHRPEEGRGGSGSSRGRNRVGRGPVSVRRRVQSAIEHILLDRSAGSAADRRVLQRIIDHGPGDTTSVSLINKQQQLEREMDERRREIRNAGTRNFDVTQLHREHTSRLIFRRVVDSRRTGAHGANDPVAVPLHMVGDGEEVGEEETSSREHRDHLIALNETNCISHYSMEQTANETSTMSAWMWQQVLDMTRAIISRSTDSVQR